MMIRSVYKRKAIVGLILLGIGQGTLAAEANDASQSIPSQAVSISSQESPQALSFSDSQSLPVVLSNTNINRIVVSGDTITHTVCPGGYCSATNHTDDPSGAAYLNIQSSMPFTAFFETEQGRHFSLQITPRQMNGQTLVLAPEGGSRLASKWEKESDYRAILENLTRDMMNGRTPEGYGYTFLQKADAINFHNMVSIQPLAVWGGESLTGIEYQVTNLTKEPLTLSPSAFYHAGVRSVALTDQTILPGNTTLMYQVISSGVSQ